MEIVLTALLVSAISGSSLAARTSGVGVFGVRCYSPWPA